MKIFVPNSLKDQNLKFIIDKLLSSNVLQPFDPSLISFVSDLSKSILLDKKARSFPELIVLANFFKLSNINLIKNNYLNDGLYYVSLSRGLIFHIAPSNVDSIFLYSSLISLLCGNVNFIRISNNLNEQLILILDKIESLVSSKYGFIKSRLVICTYDHDDEITATISLNCHMRVIWGGDSTVNLIRKLPISPIASEVCFPTRFSVSVFKAESIIKLNDNEIFNLCKRFSNDILWFSQQACSSPREVVWIGNMDVVDKARQKFWSSFQNFIENISYVNSEGMNFDRLVASYLVAANGFKIYEMKNDFPMRLLINNQPLEILKLLHCGNGLIYEQCFNDLNSYYSTIDSTYQTISVLGFSHNDIIESVKYLPMRAIDRIVNVGKSLDFGIIWDGYNLVESFTRKLEVDDI
jgi:hypothetical protein